jgi:hypothetical protein
VNFTLAVDDTDWLGAFALHPYVQVLVELDNKAGNGDDEGVYYEIGITPGLPTMAGLSVTFPIKAGFGSNSFYLDDGLGFISGGVNLAYALSFIPEKWGAWTVSANATYYYLDNDLEDFNSPTKLSAADTGTHDARVRHGSENEVVFGGGLQVAF